MGLSKKAWVAKVLYFSKKIKVQHYDAEII